MFLNLQQIQALDFLVQLLNERYSYTDKSLNLVIKINNSLWKGNFINFNSESYYIEQKQLNSFGHIAPQFFKAGDLIKNLASFELTKYSNIKTENIHLLLIDLVNIIKNLEIENVNLSSILYNAINIENNLHLPFVLLDPNAKFEVVSIVESN